MMKRMAGSRWAGRVARVTVLVALTGGRMLAGGLDLALPTDNRALFSSDPSAFYMHTNRTFEGVSSKPWTGGKFGFVRNQKRTGEGVIMTRFHEGMDIRPVRRDSQGRALDDVRPIAKGKVVYANAVPGRSSYGNYVVIEHEWDSGRFYSLYAHLADVQVKAGQRVDHRSVLGRMGDTGVGLNRARSHAHVELNLLMSKRFERWHGKHFNSPNYHGIYNGINLAGLDLPGLFLRHAANPEITIPDFMARMAVHYKVVVPNRGQLELVSRYPFLGKNLHLARNNPSWEIHFSQSGMPLAVAPSSRRVSQPEVTYVKRSETYHSYHTMGRLTGSGSSAGLSARGLRHVALVTGQF